MEINRSEPAKAIRQSSVSNHWINFQMNYEYEMSSIKGNWSERFTVDWCVLPVLFSLLFVHCVSMCWNITIEHTWKWIDNSWNVFDLVEMMCTMYMLSFHMLLLLLSNSCAYPNIFIEFRALWKWGTNIHTHTHTHICTYGEIYVPHHHEKWRARRQNTWNTNVCWACCVEWEKKWARLLWVVDNYTTKTRTKTYPTDILSLKTNTLTWDSACLPAHTLARSRHRLQSVLVFSFSDVWNHMQEQIHMRSRRK